MRSGLFHQVKLEEHWQGGKIRNDLVPTCWRRLLRLPWTARRSNQSILKEISPGSSLEGMMLKLKLQYFGRLVRRVDSKDSDAGRDWGFPRLVQVTSGGFSWWL